MKKDNQRTNVSIKNWAEDDRPREKLLKHGVSALSNAELIAILIGSGSRETSAVDLSKNILHDSENNLNELARLSLSELMRYKGIGEAKAISIVAALELGKRRKLEQVLERKQIKNSDDLFQLFYPILNDLPHEEFWLVMLNRANKVLEVKKLFQGGGNSVAVDVRQVLKTVLIGSAHSVAIAHNHPSGQLQPSQHDISITEKIAKGCKAIDVRFLDHIIIANGKYISFADENRLVF